MTLPDVTYYRYIAQGRKWAEVVVHRRDGKLGQQPTGFAYPTPELRRLASSPRTSNSQRSADAGCDPSTVSVEG